MEISDCRMGSHPMRDEWRFATTTTGAPSVTISGIILMQVLPAGRPGSTLKVRLLVMQVVSKHLPTYIPVCTYILCECDLIRCTSYIVLFKLNFHKDALI